MRKNVTIYADVRCLQDPHYRYRGIGFHTSALLKRAKDYFSKGSAVIGLVDRSLPPIPEAYQGLFDRTDCVYACSPQLESSVFVQSSPMAHCPRQVSRLLCRPDILSCAVVYDFIPFDAPQRYLPTPALLHEYQIRLNWLSAYDVYFPISKYASRRLRELLQVEGSQAHVIGVALRPHFEEALARRALGSRQTTSPPYILFVGGGDNRKNIEVLLRAVASLNTSHHSIQVRVVGGYSANQLEAIRTCFESSGGRRQQLQFQGNVSDAELATLYEGSVCTVCSSYIEGFSLPVIEGPACGSPVLASINDAHCELLGRSRWMFLPDDSQHLASMLRQIIDQPAIREEVQRAQQHIPADFTSQKVNDRFWGAISRHLIERSASRTLRLGRSRVPSRQKIAIISPFPPDRSGVAEYSQRTVEALAGLADVDVFTDAVKPEPCRAVRKFLPISEWPYLSGEYDQVLNVIGNSYGHIKSIELQIKHGGACLVHDNRLSDLLNSWRGPDYFHAIANAALRRRVTMSECQSWIADPGKLPVPFFDELIPSARPLIVHSKRLQSLCREVYGIEPAYLPFCCYRDFPEERFSDQERVAARRRLGISADECAIVSFGIVDPSKSPELCIESVRLLRNAGMNAHLHFVGPTGKLRKRLHTLSKRLGVVQAVHMTDDWVDDDQYFHFLQAADFAIQLRKHLLGGLSGALLDCIGAGIPTVANQDLAESLESPYSVLRVCDTPTAEEIAGRLLAAHQAGLHVDRDHEQRTRYVSEHRFDVYAERLLSVLGLQSAV